MTEFVVTLLKILLAISIPNIGGWIGFKFGMRHLPWYRTLKQPSFYPPKWIFAPMWIYLYSSIGIAAYLVYEEVNANHNGFDQNAQIALVLFIIQMVCNWMWQPIFFGSNSLKWVSELTSKSIRFCRVNFHNINTENLTK